MAPHALRNYSSPRPLPYRLRRGEGLSNKMTQLYKLSWELSKQDHYDFGMRAVKSVIVMAGQVTRCHCHRDHLPSTTATPSIAHPLPPSPPPAAQARQPGDPRGHHADPRAPRLEPPQVSVRRRAALHGDHPGPLPRRRDPVGRLRPPPAGYRARAPQAEPAGDGRHRHHHLHHHHRHRPSTTTATSTSPPPTIPCRWSTPTSPRSSTGRDVLVRHGVMVVGLTLTGKSTGHSMLAALTQRARRRRVRGDEAATLNPKAVKMGGYGEINPVTQEWTDGLVPTLVRLSVGDESDALNWIVFDGPVDALWIENMNTNKMLCLSNGERIVIEGDAHDVRGERSRRRPPPSCCGMVYMEAVYIGNRLPWQPWVSPTRCRRTTPRTPRRSSSSSMGMSTARSPSCATAPRRAWPPWRPTRSARASAAVGVAHRGERRVGVGRHGDAREECGLHFVFAFVWAFGGNLRESSREKFDAYVRGRGLLDRLNVQLPKAGAFSTTASTSTRAASSTGARSPRRSPSTRTCLTSTSWCRRVRRRATRTC